MRYLLVCIFLAGCSNVSFNKEIDTEPKEFNKYGMKWERSIQTVDHM